ncbi:hypothetical protein [Streptomyces sp. NPDC006274]|uniref:hypothetical protein n=1 Tax=unclassified Streptomyces TaxID=2593676 RepID=UPI0033B6D4E8
MAFPQDKLPVLVELLLGGTWTDITKYVYTRQPITITAGRPDEGQRVEPSRCQLTLNNRDGRFSGRNPLSPYFGQLGRNTPLRVSLPAATPYLLLDGDTDTKATTPDTAALDITGDLDIRIDITPTTWGIFRELAAKYDAITGDQRSWFFQITSEGELYLRWSPDGTFTNAITIRSTQTLPSSVGVRLALRATLDVDNGSGGNTVTFYTAPTIAGPWTQLGDPVITAGTTSVHAGTAELELGAADGITNLPFVGRVHAFELRNGIGGTVVANPDFTTQTPGATSFVDGAGRTWTLEGTAELINREPRFTGEVSAWPPRWDVSGRDVWTPIEAAGVMRRLGQGNKALDSTLRRAVPSFEPLAYWPMEEGADAVQAYSPIAGVRPLRLDGVTWAAADSLPSSNPLPVLASTTGVARHMSGVVPAPSAGWTGWQVRWIYRNDNPDAVTYWTFMRIACSSGTVREWFIQSRENGSRIRGYDSEGALVFENHPLTSGDLFHQWVAVRFYAFQNGATVDWRVEWQDVGGDAGGFGTSFAGTLGPVSAVTSPADGFAAALDGMAIGHLSVWPTAVSAAYDGAITAWAGETAAERLARLADEETRLNITQTAGSGSVAEAMGPQRPAALLELLRDCADADGGILHEDRERLALIYRHRSSLYNQPVALSLDYTAKGEVGPPLEPVDDDQQLRNDITITRDGGSSGRVVVEHGPLSVQAPEDGGVGIYDDAVTLNLHTDEQTEPIAGWRAHLGTWDEARFPSVRLMLHKAPHLIEDWLRFRIGDRGQIANPPNFLPPDTIDFLGQGYTEVLGQFTWDVYINATPAGPWTVATVAADDPADDGPAVRVDTDGSELAAAVTAASTELLVHTPEGGWVTTGGLDPTDDQDLPCDVRVGGEVVTATAIEPLAWDAFTRLETDTWGAADSGHTWSEAGGVASDRSVDGSSGIITLQANPGTLRFQQIIEDVADCQILVSITPNQLATGAAFLPAVLLRAAGSYYRCRLVLGTDGSVSVQLTHVVTPVGDTATTPYTYGAGTKLWLRVRIDGQRVRGRVWPDGTREPGAWQLDETVETDPIASGAVGLTGSAFGTNTNVNPSFAYDNFEVITPQRWTVTRSVNGVQKSQSAGEDLRLAQPTIVAL